MIRWPLFATIFVLTTLISCNRKKEDIKEIFKKLSWIEGNWVNEKDSTYHEMWKLTNDSTYTGKSSSNNGTDSLVEENLKIVLNKKFIKFYNEIEEQTEESKPREFHLISSNADTLIFTNTENFYPNKITYTHISDSIIAVKSERTGEGEPIKFEFTLKKEKGSVGKTGKTTL
jgi:predicted small secreted protein